MKKRPGIPCHVSLLFAAVSVWAHHSLAAEYDVTKPVSLTGTLTSVDWRNPHAWIYIDAKMRQRDRGEMAVRVGLA